MSQAPNQTAVLNALASGMCLKIDEIDQSVDDLSRRQINRAFAPLLKRDLIERVEEGCYKITPQGKAFLADGKEIKAHIDEETQRMSPSDSMRQRVWNILRMSGAHSVPELIELASENQKGSDERSNVSRLMRHLQAIGYVQKLRRKEKGRVQGSKGLMRYRLIKNTGPFVPVYSPRKKVLIDMNTSEVFNMSKEEEKDAAAS